MNHPVEMSNSVSGRFEFKVVLFTSLNALLLKLQTNGINIIGISLKCAHQHGEKMYTQLVPLILPEPGKLRAFNSSFLT